MKEEIIRKISIYKTPVRLKKPFVISLGRLDYADNVIVVIETTSGIRGFGECSPFRTIHGETGATCMSVAKILADNLKNKNALDIDNCTAIMNAVIFGNTSIKSAFDIALYDIASQNAGLPLYKFLGGKNDKKMYTDYTVSIGDPQLMAADAGKIVEDGFTVVKVKLGGSEEEDLKRIQHIRDNIGKDFPLRIDANQGWSVPTATSILKKLEQYNIQLCEEPVGRQYFMKLPKIKAATSIPIMADESCFDHHDAKRLIEIKACDMLNIKLGKSSGIFNAIKIGRLAEENNMKLQAGGFLESRLGFTAAAHLSLSNDQFIHFDFDTPMMFSEDFIEGGITYGKNGLINVPETPGLGAWVRENVLERFEKTVVEG